LSEQQRSIALTIGDPNGIGPEIAVKAALACRDKRGPRVVLVGDPFVIETYARRLLPDLPLRCVDAAACAADDAALDVLRVDALARSSFAPGTMNGDAGRATVAYVSAAIEFVRAGGASAIVACPHSETAVHTAGIAFAGYPSLIARLTGAGDDEVFLMLVGGGLRIVHATLHERLVSALARLTPEIVIAAARAAVDALMAFGITAPRIGIFGINPHAGEGGLFGTDDEVVTVPAVARLQALGIAAEGPVGADVLLGRRDLDAFVAMYHDQGHIPIKLLAGRAVAAISLGAGITFASVGHGSAFDIAGRDVADPAAVLATLELVGSLSARKVVTA
jgi:4-hydroxythreonine-4-phosphate dehydrogenase